MSLRQLKFKPIIRSTSCFKDEQIMNIQKERVEEIPDKANDLNCQFSCLKGIEESNIECSVISSTRQSVSNTINTVNPLTNIESDCKQAPNKHVQNNFLPMLSIKSRIRRKRNIHDEPNTKGPKDIRALQNVCSDRSKKSILELIKNNVCKTKALGQVMQKENQECLNKVGDICDQTLKETSCNEIEPVPQVRISSSGIVIVDEDSLSLEPPTKKTQTFHKLNATKTCNKEWSYKETIRFFKALSAVGSDFEAMKMFFPERSRNSLKNKFKREEKIHRELVDKIMISSNEYDLSEVLKELKDENKYKTTIKCLGKNLVSDKKVKNNRKYPPEEESSSEEEL